MTIQATEAIFVGRDDFRCEWPWWWSWACPRLFSSFTSIKFGSSLLQRRACIAIWSKLPFTPAKSINQSISQTTKGQFNQSINGLISWVGKKGRQNLIEFPFSNFFTKRNESEKWNCIKSTKDIERNVQKSITVPFFSAAASQGMTHWFADVPDSLNPTTWLWQWSCWLGRWPFFEGVSTTVSLLLLYSRKIPISRSIRKKT